MQAREPRPRVRLELGQPAAELAVDDPDASVTRRRRELQARGEGATLLIGVVLPRTNCRKLPGRSEAPTAQIPAFSGPAVASQRPSGLNATPLTNAVCRRRIFTSFSAFASHTRASRSRLELAINLPSGENATPVTVSVWPASTPSCFPVVRVVDEDVVSDAHGKQMSGRVQCHRRQARPGCTLSMRGRRGIPDADVAVRARCRDRQAVVAQRSTHERRAMREKTPRLRGACITLR